MNTTKESAAVNELRQKESGVASAVAAAKTLLANVEKGAAFAETDDERKAVAVAIAAVKADLEDKKRGAADLKKIVMPAADVQQKQSDALHRMQAAKKAVDQGTLDPKEALERQGELTIATQEHAFYVHASTRSFGHAENALGLVNNPRMQLQWEAAETTAEAIEAAVRKEKGTDALDNPGRRGTGSPSDFARLDADTSDLRIGLLLAACAERATGFKGELLEKYSEWAHLVVISLVSARKN